MATAFKTKSGMIIKCKACRMHFIDVPRWTFNGDVDKPTFSPSIKETCNSPDHPSYQAQAKSSCYHFIITDGKIAYCGDCTHDLRGQTLELEHWNEAEIEHYSGAGYQD